MCGQAYFRLTLGRKMAVPALCFPKVQGKMTQNETTPLGHAVAVPGNYFFDIFAFATLIIGLAYEEIMD